MGSHTYDYMSVVLAESYPLCLLYALLFWDFVFHVGRSNYILSSEVEEDSN